MQQASEALNFERAAQLRDQMAILRRVQQAPIASSHQDLDLVVARVDGGVAVICVCMVRHGMLMGKQCHIVDLPLGQEQLFLADFLLAYYLNPSRSGQRISSVYVDAKIDNKKAVEGALKSSLKCAVRIISRWPKSFAPWKRLAALNALHALEQHHDKHSSWFKKMTAINRCLKVENTITRIECFDISHTSGRETRGACVVFNQKGKQKSLYRQYAIQQAEGGDDYAAMREVLWRRYKKLLEQDQALPDLILIDGGKGQINIAAQVVQDLQLHEVLIASVVKGAGRRHCHDRLLIYPSMCYINLKDNQELLFAVQQIRDEAHRFAIQAHRRERKKQAFRSPLDAIDGIGVVLKKRLLQHFGGMGAVLNASVEALADVKGISMDKALQIHQSLHHYQDIKRE